MPLGSSHSNHAGFRQATYSFMFNQSNVEGTLPLIHSFIHCLSSYFISLKQIRVRDFWMLVLTKYNRRQQRNGPTVHDVTSVKYSKEDKFYFFISFKFLWKCLHKQGLNYLKWKKSFFRPLTFYVGKVLLKFVLKTLKSRAV